jgi:type IV pilus assembly protein PilB
MSAAKKIGELLVQENKINVEQLEKAKVEQRNHGGRLGTALVKLGYIKENELAEFMGKQYNVSPIDLAAFEVDSEVVKLVPKEVCEKHMVFPVSKAGNTIVIAMADPSNIFVRDDLAFVTRLKVEVVVAAETAILSAIDKYYGSRIKADSILQEIEREDAKQKRADKEAGKTPQTMGGQVVEVVDLDSRASKDDAPVIKLVNLVLSEAIKTRCSDIHIEPYEQRFRIRYRIDGVLYERMQPPTTMAPAITSRIKIMSQLDISEKRRPQDGRMKVKFKNGTDLDFRVSVLPTLFGEKIVLRILDKTSLQLDMTKLGFEPDELTMLKEAILEPYGMVLVTGPTGSGKSTTIYSALLELNKIDVNIATAEDPVEFNLEGINQVQMNPEIDLNFASALRSFLRQDPDVIMVGEIRDYETAEIAIKAALTGHLVVSTLHTNDAPSTVFRLLNMGVEPFLVASTINCVVAQRLVRKICQDCKDVVPVDAELLIKAGIPSEKVSEYQCMRGKGCPTCNDIGYKGRVAIYEVMKFTETVKQGILKGVTPIELKQLAVADGMRTLRMNALNKLKAGLTTFEEVIENTAKD